MESRHPKPTHASYRAHRTQVTWQILAPVILAALLLVAAAVLVSLAAARGTGDLGIVERAQRHVNRFQEHGQVKLIEKRHRLFEVRGPPVDGKREGLEPSWRLAALEQQMVEHQEHGTAVDTPGKQHADRRAVSDPVEPPAARVGQRADVGPAAHDRVDDRDPRGGVVLRAARGAARR